ncbi:MAG TPA: PEP/pyruvate-binding domain-containing protein [Bryobacteraceae bacterium]|nr:PEP/pyruvate-binding domain-containing protein [Bryobacteraceae bacterium]
MPIGGFLKKLFSREQPEEAENINALRIEFKDRYHSFKLLLGANHKALEVMAEIEEALHASRPFGMSFVRAACTTAAVNVFSMVRNIEKLAPGKYAGLFERFDHIQKAIDEVLTRRAPAADKRLVIPLGAVTKDTADLVGSKMANLGEIKNGLKLRVPPGFAITAAAYQRFLEHNDLQAEIDRRMQAAESDRVDARYSLSAEIQQMIIRAEVPVEIVTAIRDAWSAMESEAGGPVTAALRSSALGEDAAGSSFAGQYRSELNVSADTLLDAYRNVVASKYSLQAITYRLTRGFRDEDVAMCVGCIAMVDAVAGGVTYSRNPVDIHDDRVFTNAVWGLPKAVVDGSAACDLFVVARGEPMAVVAEDIRPKDRKFVCYPEEGVCRMDLTGDERQRPSITHAQAVELARLAVVLERHYGTAQDVEWAIDTQGVVTLLQCRPLQQKPVATTHPGAAAAPAADGTSAVFRGGVTASPGAASGPVFIAEKDADILAFPEGAILMVRQAEPRWASLLNRAAAVVAEEGGFAGHLANVAREFGVPALFAVPAATRLLPTGELATVDATGQSIHRGRIEALLQRAPQRPSLMQGSPVYEILREASRLIVPLGLLEPESPEFAPATCKSLHDITRFIHEKSVHEMFNFGRDHGFSERSSKQLHYKVPMQWWVLNLDDGFTEEIGGKYVQLEQIACVPMLAFWKGFTAIPWEGPPAMDGKGMLSVMFRATTNQALTVGVKSKYAERNYFMISRNYCSLSQRLGFHFSTLEALVSERAPENYVSYQFKGGAADVERRIARVHFIAEILEPIGFRVEIREDHLLARVEGQGADDMLKQVEILGYLALHTRQMDMVMSNPAYVEHYRAKYRRDIEGLIASREPERS